MCPFGSHQAPLWGSPRGVGPRGVGSSPERLGSPLFSGAECRGGSGIRLINFCITNVELESNKEEEEEEEEEDSRDRNLTWNLLTLGSQR
jgi:hypothetical protein